MADEVRATAILFDKGEEQEVVGESHYQDAFVKIAGPKTEDGHNLSVVAALVPEPDNPHDPMAVEVRVDGRKVGHLPADVAEEYQPVLLRIIKERDLYVACHARIKGGWRRAGKDIGSFGITLTSFPTIAQILASPEFQSSPVASTANKGGCLGVVAVAALGLCFFAVTVAAAVDAPEPALPKLDNGKMGYQEIVIAEGVEAQELLSRARSWVAQSYKSAQAVIQLDDAAAGSLVVKGTFTIAYMGGLSTVSIPHVLTVEAKPGRYRFTLSDFTYLDIPIEDDKALGKYVPTKNGRAKTRERIAVVSEATVASLKAAMQAPTPAKSDW